MGFNDYDRMPRRRRSISPRLMIGAVIALFAIASYFMQSNTNPITGENQRVAMTTDEEIALGLQAKPEMIAQYGGLDPNEQTQAAVDSIGRELLDRFEKELSKQGRTIPYPFDFHVLHDEKTVNAFALPGGQVFITDALVHQLTDHAELAGVIGHEIGHVLSRHSAQQLAKQQLTQGLAGAAGVAGGTYDSARMAQMVADMVNMKFGRDDELEADQWGVRLMGAAGYDPRAMIDVMEILEKASGDGPPEFLSTHPKPANRVGYIKDVIAEVYPDGIPEGMRR